MNKHTTLSLDDHSAEFIEQQIDGGNFASASEVVAAGLKLLEERQAKIEALRAAIIEGEESGPSTPFDFDEFIARKRRERGL
ncbi:type II toxin-antitoxin system ParD family antitoxin [Mesorhizobium sp. J428]|jgi:antitoxin ParD1/3/4|uniref:type II toxin-antitoxin system ParD family antitoxin n=1 Tax=Mesorhizobium sp. J428 TaxID=2898440 RepID=UPI0021510D29|nr:type II toxin-antitoxin system ParD family antitoxin [Mesorhizobium sp. J428]MCR5856146.1 type II toxin-antitoxin system ParD family antitoxin [Mesorhizobium sp. J428]